MSSDARRDAGALEQQLLRWTPWVVGAVAVLAVGWWFSVDPTSGYSELVPGMDRSAEAMAQEELEVVTVGELFSTFDGVPAAIEGSWPHFRGEGFDNVVNDGVALLDGWGEDGPEVLFSIELGEGHAAPAVWSGRVYVLDYDEQEGADALRCFSLADGREIWRRWYHVKVKRNHGLSRTIPAVADGFVVTIGPRCHVMAVDAVSGELLWGFDLKQRYGTETPFWYTGQCPLIDEGVAVLAPAGSMLLVGLDCATGEVVWETPNPSGWKMSHSSVIPMTLAGKRMYVYAAIGGVAAVSAEAPDLGTLLWQTDEFAPSVVAPSPLPLGDDRLLITAGYGAGGMVLQVARTGNGFVAEAQQRYLPGQGLASEQQTPVVADGVVYGILPKDAGELREQLVCYDPQDCTRPLWSSGPTVRFGLGPYLVADGKLFILSDDGTLTLARATASGYEQLAQAKVLDGVDAWGPPALVGGRLLLRDSKRLICLDVRALTG